MEDARGASMTAYASTCLFTRDEQMRFRKARREISTKETQARKSATRYWRNVILEPDALEKIVVVCVVAGSPLIEIAERNPTGRDWHLSKMEIAAAAEEPHLMSCLDLLGVDPKASPPPMPDVLEINGFIYKREL